MKALRQSVIDYCRRKRVRESPFGEIENSESLENGFIQKMEFMEWSEANAPLLPSAMATFIHFIFFSETPYPPSRTAFDFPKLPEESAFFHSASSTMLFSFACMSSALGGSVSLCLFNVDRSVITHSNSHIAHSVAPLVYMFI
jgi:hypothetical protein